jgi:hypothetical protein
MRPLLLSLIVFLSMILTAQAQTEQQSSGWLLLLNNTKINKNWGMYVDLQMRSNNNFDGVKNLMFRPGLTYYLNDKNEFTVGYLVNETFTRLDGASDNSLTEQRIWEQYVFKHKLNTVAASHRLRLEQRFIGRRGADDLFSQRLRYFFRFQIPLQKGSQPFDKGMFVALQNEVFLNLQNKDQLNTHFFDQNRGYAAAGYRFSKKLDIELGYLNQAIKGARNNSVNNVIQVAVYTKF